MPYVVGTWGGSGFMEGNLGLRAYKVHTAGPRGLQPYRAYGFYQVFWGFVRLRGL